MPQTPDRFPGEREDEGLILSDEGLEPDKDGEVRYNSGDFRMKDHLGVFNPRSSGGGTTPTHRDQILFANGSVFTPGRIVVDDNYNIVCDDNHEIVVGE